MIDEIKHIFSENLSLIGEIGENGQQMTVHHHCAESCRESVKHLREEVLFLRNLVEHQLKIIEQLQDHKKSLIDLLDNQRNEFLEDVKFEIQDSLRKINLE